MNCDELQRARLEDRPPVSAIAEHAASCPSCARLLREEAALEAAVAAWRDATPAAPTALRERVLEATAAATPRDDGVIALPPARPASRWWSRPALGALAAAALIVVVAGLALDAPRRLTGSVISTRGGLLVDDALAAARDAERRHAEAIATLVEAARPVLARIDAPDVDRAEVARLRAYRDRLASVDDAIRQVRTFLDTNPGHTSGRTMLLAAYIDKTELLGEILAMAPQEEQG